MIAIFDGAPAGSRCYKRVGAEEYALVFRGDTVWRRIVVNGLEQQSWRTLGSAGEVLRAMRGDGGWTRMAGGNGGGFWIRLKLWWIFG